MLISKNNLIPAALVITSLFSSGTFAADGDAKAGELKAISCLGCHGVSSSSNVYPTYKVPKVAGQHAAYLMVAIRNYREKSRYHGSMQLNTEDLTDQDIADIAAYFSTANN